LSNLRIDSTGIYFNGKADVDSGWQRFLDQPFSDDGDVYGRLQGQAILSVSAQWID
jgi:hypothetical protein